MTTWSLCANHTVFLNLIACAALYNYGIVKAAYTLLIRPGVLITTSSNSSILSFALQKGRFKVYRYCSYNYTCVVKLNDIVVIASRYQNNVATIPCKHGHNYGLLVQ